MAEVSIDQSKLIKYSLIAVALIIVIAILVYAVKAIRNFFGFKEEEETRVVFSNTPYVDGGGSIDASFPIESHVSELHNVLGEWLIDASPRCAAYERLMDLSDNEFIAVLNAYYDTYGETVRSKMNATIQSGCSFFGKQWDDRVQERMDRLNVNA